MKIGKVIIFNMLAMVALLTPTAYADDLNSPTQPAKTQTEQTQLLFQAPLSAGTHSLSTGFGEQINPETKTTTTHNGLDFAAPKGTAIYSSFDGVVVLADHVKGYEEAIIIKHNSELSSLYGNILPGSYLVKAGDAVKKGQKIAEVGSSEVKGSHLHFSVFKQGLAVNPNDYFYQSSK